MLELRRGEATAAAVRAAYKRLALALHPDLPVGCFELVARYAYSARRFAAGATPVVGEEILAAVRCMKM